MFNSLAMPRLRVICACFLLVLLAACSGTKKGGYYKDDGPEANPPANLDKVPDAVPKIEPLARGANKPYSVFGRQYAPDVSGGPYKLQGRASWYGKKFHGNPTSNGERYDMYAMTAAHTTLPIPSYVRVTRVSNGKSVVLRVNDRGPFHSDRIIDLSYVAAYKLGMLGPGSGEVVVERITEDQIRNGQPLNTAPVRAPVQSALNAAPAKEPVLLPPPPSQPTSFATVATQETRSTSAPGAMFLQLGAFSDPSKAQTLATRVTQQMPANVNAPVLVDRNANNLYRVRIGPFASRDAATEALLPIQNATGVTPNLSQP